MTLKKSNSAQSLQGIDLLFSMLLLLMFILCSVFTILVGSRVYENIRARDDAAFYSDTALSYVTNKIRQADRSDCIEVRSIDDHNVLVLTSSSEDGTIYETWIYTLDGSLKELYSEKNSGLMIEDGLDIMRCQSLSFSLEDSDGGRMLTTSLQTETSEKKASIFLRSTAKGGL
ncbi:MAG: DUF4860 domain-containing protein [Clostridium sp.]